MPKAFLYGWMGIFLSLGFPSGVKIWTPNGSLSISQYKRSPASFRKRPAARIASKKIYAWAVFSRPFDKPTRNNLESTLGIRFLSVHDVVGGHVIYHVCFKMPVASMRDDLAGIPEE